MSTGRYHWSNLAPSAKFFILDAKAAIPWIALPLAPSWTLLGVAVGVTLFFVYVEVIRKLTITAFLRTLGMTLIGYERRARNHF